MDNLEYKSINVLSILCILRYKSLSIIISILIILKFNPMKINGKHYKNIIGPKVI